MKSNGFSGKLLGFGALFFHLPEKNKTLTFVKGVKVNVLYAYLYQYELRSEAVRGSQTLVPPSRLSTWSWATHARNRAARGRRRGQAVGNRTHAQHNGTRTGYRYG